MQLKKKALVLVADDFEDSELLCPMNRLLEAGFQVDVASIKAGTVKGKKGYEVEAGLALDKVEDAGSCGYRVLLIPGGKSPARLLKESAALDIVRDFVSSGLPIAAICHGPQLLAAAGVISGKKLTCYPKVADELKAAGALYEDAEVVVDKGFITSRVPSDIPAFNKAMMSAVGA